MNKQRLKAALPHLLALMIFILLATLYFYPQTKGYSLRTSDTKTFLGMSKEIFDYRDKFNKEPLWTNSMFGGMPAYQISVEHNKNLIRSAQNILIMKVFGHPIATFLLCLLGFYVMLLCFRVDPWLSIIGAIAFGFATMNILYLGAGHNSRVIAIALMPPIVGGIFYTFRRKMFVGAALTALFICLHVSANHIQETYYLLFLILAVVTLELYLHAKQKLLPRFLKAAGLLVVAAFIGLLPTISNLITTNEYSKYTTRGKSELSKPLSDEKQQENKKGLSPWYIKQYNIGKGETWALVIPNVKGGKSGYLGMFPDKIKGNVSPQFREAVSQQSSYWGAQRFTGGAIYLGAAVFLLFILGMVFIKEPWKYALLVVSALAIVLSWKNSAILDFFINNVPLFDKFRDSKIMLILVQLSFPLVAVLFLKDFVRQKTDYKKTLYTILSVVGVFVIMYLTPRTWFSFFSETEVAQLNEQLKTLGTQNTAQFRSFMDDIEQVRIAIFKADVLRSLLFVLISGALVLIFIKSKMKKGFLFAALGLVILIDLWFVNKRYLDNEKQRGTYIHWIEKYIRKNPFRASTADIAILQAEMQKNPQLAEKIQFETQRELSKKRVEKKYLEIEKEKIAFRELNFATNYRVFTFEDPFNNSTVSYYHKSIGGYHGAKLRKYQELIEARITGEFQIFLSVLKNNPTDSAINALLRDSIPTLNMLNTKYIIYNSHAAPLQNEYHNGNAWFVKEAKIVPDADHEISALDAIDPKNTAVINDKFIRPEDLNFQFDSAAKIELKEYLPDHLIYESTSTNDQLAVFSEIYYPEGWKVFIDGKQTDYFRANYVLRSMIIPKGNHKIEFKFEPKSFTRGENISLVGSFLLLLFLGGALYFDFRKKPQQVATKDDVPKTKASPQKETGKKKKESSK